jgi:hypothetical protein
MNWTGCGRQRSWPNLRHYSSICLDGLRKITDLGQDSMSEDRELNLGTPEYERVLTTRPRCLVTLAVLPLR